MGNCGVSGCSFQGRKVACRIYKEGINHRVSEQRKSCEVITKRLSCVALSDGIREQGIGQDGKEPI